MKRPIQFFMKEKLFVCFSHYLY